MKRKIVSVLLAAAMAVSLAACGGSGTGSAPAADGAAKTEEAPADTEDDTEETTPSAGEETAGEESAGEDGITMVCALRDGEYSPAEIQLYQELEEKTGIEITWETYPQSAWPEKKSLLIASNDLPDAFFGSWVLTSDEVVKYGSEGILIPLEDYITEETTPNLWKIFQDYPDYKSAVTAPDGHIYSLMGFEDGYTVTTNQILYINKDWLEAVNMEVPTTTEEFREVLRAFKEQDPNGNGVADEIPYSFHKGTNYCSDLFGAFGIPDRTGSPKEHIGVKDGKVVWTAAEDSYKEAIKYFNSLFAEGLIDQEAFTQDGSVFNAKVKSEERIVGVLQAWRSTGWALEDGDDTYIPMGPLAGPDGTRYFPEYQNGITDLGSMAITKDAEDPETIMSWVDENYDPLFSVQASLALKVGLHLEDAGDGTYKFAEPATTENRAKVVPGGGERIYNVSAEAAALLEECPAHLVEKREIDPLYNQYYWPEVYPTFLFSAEESAEIASLTTEIATFTSEKYASWMMNGGIDEEWDSYLKKLDDMGLQDLLAVYQEGLDRYKANL